MLRLTHGFSIYDICETKDCMLQLQGNRVTVIRVTAPVLTPIREGENSVMFSIVHLASRGGIFWFYTVVYSPPKII